MSNAAMSLRQGVRLCRASLGLQFVNPLPIGGPGAAQFVTAGGQGAAGGVGEFFGQRGEGFAGFGKLARRVERPGRSGTCSLSVAKLAGERLCAGSHNSSVSVFPFGMTRSSRRAMGGQVSLFLTWRVMSSRTP